MSKLKEFFKKYFNYLLFILVAILTLYIIYNEVDYKEFIQIVKHSEYEYLILAVLFLFLYWIMESYMLQKLIQYEYPDEDLKHAFALAMIGMYYNQVTPGASGGQPMQLIEMRNKGISTGFATAVLVQKYALYQLSVTIVGLIGISFNIPLVLTWPPLGRIMLYIGTGVNVFGSVLILLVAFKPAIAKIILDWCVNFAYKIHLIKDKQKWDDKVVQFVSDYKIAIANVKGRLPQIVMLLLFNILAILVFYGITYWIYRAFGLSELNAITIILIQSVLYLMIAFVPLPGAAGGAEVGFAIVFSAIFGAAQASIALIIWRIITFYFVLAFGGIFIAVRSLLLGSKKPKQLTSKTKEVIRERDSN